MAFSIKVSDISEVGQAAEQLLNACKGSRMYAVFGEMGAGKTTLIKEICRILGYSGHVTSPTFTIVNEYRTEKNEIIFHIDFYRIGDEKEAYDIGYEEYFYGTNWCFIEWPEKVADLVPEHFVRVNITLNSDFSRTISCDE